MPRILEIKEIDGEVWVRVGKIEDNQSPVSLWTNEERIKEKRSSYNLGYDMAKEGEPKDIYHG